MSDSAELAPTTLHPPDQEMVTGLTEPQLPKKVIEDDSEVIFISFPDFDPYNVPRVSHRIFSAPRLGLRTVAGEVSVDQKESSI